MINGFFVVHFVCLCCLTFNKLIMKKNTFLFIFLTFTLLSTAQNTALDFDGSSNQYIETSTMVPLTNSFTVMGWIYAKAGHTQIFSWGSSTVNKYIQIKTNFNYTFQIYTPSVINLSSTTSILNGWHHIAVTNNSGTVDIYVDGVNEGSATADFSSINPTKTTLGGALLNGSIQGSGNYDIDELSIWNVALSGTEVSTYMSAPPVGTETGLVLAYDFNPVGVVAGGDNATLTTINDLTGTFTGTLTGFTLNGTTSNYINSTNSTLSVNENINQLEFSLYPNPTKDYLNVDYANDIAVSKVKLYNNLGVLVNEFNPSHKQFDMSIFPAGFYFLEIGSNRGKVSYKVVKK